MRHVVAVLVCALALAYLACAGGASKPPLVPDSELPDAGAVE
jgi:hypothetical protein